MLSENDNPDQKPKGMSVKVSYLTRTKALQLQKFQKYSKANGAWGKDQKLLQCNLLLVPTSVNYTVLLAFGRRKT